MHTAADGRRYLIMHGDEFDVVVRYAKWAVFLGDWGYVAALWSNTHLNRGTLLVRNTLLVAFSLSEVQHQAGCELYW